MTISDGVPAFIAFGTNLPFGVLGGPALIRAAIAEMAHEGLTLAALSAMHTTAAWPDPSEPAYTNAVGLFYADTHDVQDVMGRLLAVEARFGRVRARANAPRTLDLDLLDFAGQVMCTATVNLPHPRMRMRLFVLEPLAEIAPDWRDPATGASVSDLIRGLRSTTAPDP